MENCRMHLAMSDVRISHYPSHTCTRTHTHTHTQNPFMLTGKLLEETSFTFPANPLLQLLARRFSLFELKLSSYPLALVVPGSVPGNDQDKSYFTKNTESISKYLKILNTAEYRYFDCNRHKYIATQYLKNDEGKKKSIEN